MSTRRMIVPLALTVLAAACGKKRGQGDEANAMVAALQQKLGLAVDTTAPGQEKTGDPCSLLDPTEVAAAIGPLAAPPFRGDFQPSEGASSCRYETKDHRRLLIDVDWSGGPTVMSMIHWGRGMTDLVSKRGVMKTGASVLASGDTLVGDWDEVAQAPMACCDLHALRGDQHIELDWTGTRLTMAQAGALLEAAVKRLDHPLAIDGTAGLPAARALYAADARDSTVDMCALVPQAVAESVLGGKLAGPPQRGDAPGALGARACTYRLATPPDEPVQEYDLTLSGWRDGPVQFAEDQYTLNMVANGMRGQATAAAPDTTEHPPGPWDEIGYMSSPGYEAVKGPLLVQVGALGHRQQALALLARAITALSAAH